MLATLNDSIFFIHIQADVLRRSSGTVLQLHILASSLCKRMRLTSEHRLRKRCSEVCGMRLQYVVEVTLDNEWKNIFSVKRPFHFYLSHNDFRCSGAEVCLVSMRSSVHGGTRSSVRQTKAPDTPRSCTRRDPRRAIECFDLLLRRQSRVNKAYDT